MTLTPGQYQLGGLHSGIDDGAFVDGLGGFLSTDDVSVGALFFYQPEPPYGRADFGPVSQFYLSSGVEMGPMLFVPEPAAALMGSLGLLAILRRRR
jgi:hypothetical protein